MLYTSSIVFSTVPARVQALKHMKHVIGYFLCFVLMVTTCAFEACYIDIVANPPSMI
jgi:hypothetical protein